MRYATRTLTVLDATMTRKGSRLELIGQWLLNAGFEAGQKVRVSVGAGRLVIEQPERSESE